MSRSPLSSPGSPEFAIEAEGEWGAIKTPGAEGGETPLGLGIAADPC
jgi:hypothetical protein